MNDEISKIDIDLLKEKYPHTFDKAMDKINNGYPIQYLIGDVNFYGYKIKVDERVLIPRFETEMLVDETIKLIKNHIIEPNIIDICTGSGCIAIALSKSLNTKVTAIDISEEALDLALENAILNKAHVKYFKKDIKQDNIEGLYNVLISNPPYIDINTKIDKRTKYEPRIALYAQDKGLEYYKYILSKAQTFLIKQNIIALEIDPSIKEDLITLIRTYFPNGFIMPKKDLNNLDRFIFVINE